MEETLSEYERLKFFVLNKKIEKSSVELFPDKYISFFNAYNNFQFLKFIRALNIVSWVQLTFIKVRKLVRIELFTVEFLQHTFPISTFGLYNSTIKFWNR